MTAGTIIAMWLGELITENGVGNGVLLIIFVGIIGRLPAAIVGYAAPVDWALIQLVVMTIIAVVVTKAGVIEVYSRRSAKYLCNRHNASSMCAPGWASQGRRNFLPLRVNAAG